ncbi:hypothetical protein VB774_07945 [Pseudanabaena galeata UHCC 0370]|jgi:hypothetical protein|uniref:vWA-MoxR associated protein N-terminal HTH domain-containing protein n=1 Tax=Pseudanabaena galeata UHCC 0370 TaxID=3110310 RepID=A0ABU5TH19_9CYAN|nr:MULTISPECIES: hypothetical protein [Pseudanabaena]MEA5477549.1 hypothetical protein [Pseudanabaena galeata UHCC 0370]MEA5485736.1 hypothetical protein [Pseudanabaena sp. CCNP1317]WGS72081.1 hypothetical protein OA858_20605 [Pseudanabaena galeata CCNP1313]
MTIEDALNIVDSVLGNKSLSTIQEAIFRQTWEGKTYSEIAEKAGYDAAYIRDVGYKLWQLLSEAFGDRVTKNNLQVVLRRYSNRALTTNPNISNTYQSAINSQMVSATTSPVNLPMATESFSQEISNGASKLLQLLARVLTEPIGDRPINHHWQQIHDSNTDSSLKLTITVNLSMAD